MTYKDTGCTKQEHKALEQKNEWVAKNESGLTIQDLEKLAAIGLVALSFLFGKEL